MRSSKPQPSWSLGLAAALVLVSATLCRAQFAELAARVPDGANAVFIIDVDQIMRSQLATNQGWSTKQQAMYEAGLLMLPPEASQVLAATKLDFETMRPEWQVFLMNLKREPAMSQLAERYNGTLDRVGRNAVVVLPGESYFAQLGPRMGGFGEPANRQDVARWMKRIETASLAGLSPYLQVAKQFAQQNAHLIVAIDLEDVLGVEEVKAKLAAFESLKGKGIDLDKASQALASIRGLTLGLTVTDRRNGGLRVDFNEDISVIRDVAKPLLLEALGNQGMMINEFRDWNVQVSEKQVRLSGILEDGGTRRLLSFLDTPPSLQLAEDQPAAKPTPESLVRLASQQYFSSIRSLLGDLRNDKQNRQTMGQISVFFRNYARRIDRLPILNVDPVLVSFGRWVSTSLREGQIAVTEAAGRSRVGQMEVSQANAMNMGMQSGVVWGGAVGGGGMQVAAAGFQGWGGFCPRAADQATGQAQALVRTQERQRGTMSASLILQAIDNAAADMRVAMTQKYNVEF